MEVVSLFQLRAYTNTQAVPPVLQVRLSRLPVFHGQARHSTSKSQELVAIDDIVEIWPGEAAPVDGELLDWSGDGNTPGRAFGWGATAALMLGLQMLSLKLGRGRSLPLDPLIAPFLAQSRIELGQPSTSIKGRSCLG